MKFLHCWAVAALSVVVLGATALAHAASVSGQGTWETTLQSRDLDGNLSTAEAYYDTALNITWLANGNASDMNWTDANTWAANLNINGYTGWRLPMIIDTGLPGCDYAYSGTDCGYNVDTSTSEIVHMWYITLGNKAYYDTTGNPNQSGWGLTNTGPFTHIINVALLHPNYWTATEYAPDTSRAWYFGVQLGNQEWDGKSAPHWVWAVHSGDVGAAVATVPVPAAVWLFGSGLLGLIGVARRKKRAV